MYHIGKITNTHGIRGEVKIYNLSDFNRFFIDQEIYVFINKEKHYLTIERVRPQGNLLIVKFKAYDNINDILYLKGLDVYSDDDVSDQLEEDDYHYETLIDSLVYLDDQTYVGKVISLIEVPQGHLLEIEKTDGKKVLVPFVDEFIRSIEDGKMIIAPIEGLL